MKYVLINTFQHILTQHYFINIALFLRSPVSTVCLILFEGITKDLIHLFPYFWFVSSISSEPNILWWKSNAHVWKKSKFSPLLLSLLDFHMKSSDPVETLERLIEILLLQGRRNVKKPRGKWYCGGHNLPPGWNLQRMGEGLELGFTLFNEILLVFEVPYQPRVKGMPGKSKN